MWKNTDLTLNAAKGSLSVFFTLILPLLLSLCFSMLEVTRICGLDRNSKELARQMLENAFSEYQPVLWERYGVLALDMGYASGQPNVEKISGHMMELGSWYGETGEGKWMNHWLALSPQLCEVTAYELLTDQDGAPLIRQGAETAGNSVVSGLLEQWIFQAQEAEDMQKGSPDLEALIERGEQALLEERSKQEVKNEEQWREKMQNEGQKQEDPLPLEDNPLDIFAKWKEKGLLALLLPAGESIASGYLDIQSSPSQRKRMCGTKQNRTGVGLVDKVLFGHYILERVSFFSKAQEEEENAGLLYEAEYILEGKMSDRENLEGAAVKMLLLREIQNLAAIYMDPLKVQQAQRAALSLAGFTANPAVIQMVKAAVTAVWAFVESILDVRLLLAGGTVPVIKRASDWTSDLTRLGQYVSPEQTAKSSDQGMTYSDYLRIFLTLLPKKSLGLRSCDVMEQEICSREGYEAVRMDHLVCEMETTCSFQAQPVFLCWVKVEDRKVPAYSFTKKARLSYGSPEEQTTEGRD